jgi:hypothetical protein
MRVVEHLEGVMRKYGVSFGVALMALGLFPATALADPTTGTLFYTLNHEGATTPFGEVYRISYNYNGTNLITYSGAVGINTTLPGVDDILFLPNANLLVGGVKSGPGGTGIVYELQCPALDCATAPANTAAVVDSALSGTEDGHQLALSGPSGNTLVYVTANGNTPNCLPTSSPTSQCIGALTLAGDFGLGADGETYTVSGDDTDIRKLAYDPINNKWFYGSGFTTGTNTFGTIVFNDATNTAVTTRILDAPAGGHSVTYDPYTKNIFIATANSIVQFDGAFNTAAGIRSSHTFANCQGPVFATQNNFDNGVSDGLGRFFQAGNAGCVAFLDFSNQAPGAALIGSASTFKDLQFLGSDLDSVTLAPAATVIPEPGTLMLFGTGVLVLARRYSRRRPSGQR